MPPVVRAELARADELSGLSHEHFIKLTHALSRSGLSAVEIAGMDRGTQRVGKRRIDHLHFEIASAGGNVNTVYSSHTAGTHGRRSLR